MVLAAAATLVAFSSVGLRAFAQTSNDSKPATALTSAAEEEVASFERLIEFCAVLVEIADGRGDALDENLFTGREQGERE